MEGGQNSDSDQFSLDDSFNALTDEDFDLLQLTEEERAELDLVALVNREGNEGEVPVMPPTRYAADPLCRRLVMPPTRYAADPHYVRRRQHLHES